MRSPLRRGERPTARSPLAAATLADLSLEQLGNIVVMSVSRREESLAQAPASIYVIRAEDIRRAGVTSLPEAQAAGFDQHLVKPVKLEQIVAILQTLPAR